MLRCAPEGEQQVDEQKFGGRTFQAEGKHKPRQQ